MKAHISPFSPAILLWIALCGVPGETFAWLWTTGTPATPHPAVARIFALDTRGASLGTGTLVAVGPYHGLVITNWHVVRDAKGAVLVQFPDGFASPATVLKVDRDWDLAALAIWRPRARPVPIAVEPPRPGEILTIAGYGQGDYRVSYGPCTQYLSPSPNLPAELVELRATARQGDSGGPIFNSRGELVGVLFGSGFRETMGSYCGRVRSFLMPLRDVFNNLPPPDPLLVQATAAGAPQVSSGSNMLANTQAMATQSDGSSATGTAIPSPVQVPLIAGTQGTGVNNSATGPIDRSQTSVGSRTDLASIPASLAMKTTDTTGVYGSSYDSKGWRESRSDSSAYSASLERSNGVARNGAGESYETTSHLDRASNGGQVATQSPASSGMSSSGSSFAYSQKPTGKSTESYSTSYPYSGSIGKESDSSAGETGAYGGTLSEGYSRGYGAEERYSYNYESSRSGSSSESYGWNKDNKSSWGSDHQGTDNVASDDGKATWRGGDSAASTGDVREPGRPRARYANNSSSKGEGYGSSYEGSFGKDSGTPPYSYGLDRSGASEFAARDSRDYGQDAEGSASYGYGSSSESSRKQRGDSQKYTASINTGSATDDSKDESLDNERDSDTPKYGAELSRTISPKKAESYQSSSSYSGYSPIPVYDEGESEETFTTSKSPYTSSSDSNSGYRDNSTNGAESHASAHRRSGHSGYQYPEDSSEDSRDGTGGSGSSDGNGKNTQQNHKPRNQTLSDSDASAKARNNPQDSKYSFQANSSAGSLSNPSGKNAAFSQDSGTSETHSRSSDDSESRTMQSADRRVLSDSGNNTSGATKQEPAAKPTPGWETMIGIVGLLILFIQSMRWLSLLYDRSYYQRRRSYRPVRRRTAWSSTPPPSYRWYY